ncbi:hypothetical protein HanHA89_Chr16g0681731 [Helianthus annuus]|nr:hypothetical protein HanHA89_Chr16g0681731 [Helianthus annuus]
MWLTLFVDFKWLEKSRNWELGFHDFKHTDHRCHVPLVPEGRYVGFCVTGCYCYGIRSWIWYIFCYPVLVCVYFEGFQTSVYVCMIIRSNSSEVNIQ